MWILGQVYSWRSSGDIDVSGVKTARLGGPLASGTVAGAAVCWNFGPLTNGRSDVLEVAERRQF